MISKSSQDSIRLYKSSDYAINSCKPIAIIVGLWPINFQDSPTRKIISIILNFVAVSLMMFRFISNILFGIFQLKGLAQKAQISGPACFQLMNILKYLLLLIRGERIENCFKHVREDWYRIQNEEQREVMIKNAQYGRYITVICTVFICLGGLAYNIIIPLTSKSIITHRNISVKPFPSPVYGKFLTSGLTPIYELVYTGQILSAFFLYSVSPVSIGFVAVLTMHACGQFEIVMLYFSKLLDKFADEKKTVHEKFVTIVNSHLHVLRFVANLESTFTELCFIEIMGCTIDLCLLGYYIIMSVKQSNYSVLIAFTFLSTSFLFNIFIYCYIGELLVHKAKQVEESGYMIDWYLLPKRTAKDLLFFLRCAQSISKLTAGKVIILSLRTFCSVIKTAGAYCNALWNMTN